MISIANFTSRLELLNREKGGGETFETSGMVITLNSSCICKIHTVVHVTNTYHFIRYFAATNLPLSSKLPSVCTEMDSMHC